VLIFWHVLGVFSAAGYQFELIPFALGHVYSRHKFRVPARPILERKIINFIYTIPLLRGVE
jgi:hypothetical protein